MNLQFGQDRLCSRWRQLVLLEGWGWLVVGCWNHLTSHSLSGIWCYQSAGGPVGFSATALICGLSLRFLTFFLAWWLGSKSKCPRRVRWGCVSFMIQPRKSQNITSALVTSPSRLEGKTDPISGGEKCQHYHVRRTCGKGCDIKVIFGKYNLSQGLRGRNSGPLDQTGSETSGNRSQISQGKYVSPLMKSLPPPPGPLPVFIITVCEEGIYSEEAWGIFVIWELTKSLVGVCLDSMVAYGQRAHKILLKPNLSMAALFISITP